MDLEDIGRLALSHDSVKRKGTEARPAWYVDDRLVVRWLDPTSVVIRSGFTARERLLRGELDEFPDDVRVAFTKASRLAPEMFLWLSARYLEHRSINGIVEGFERFLAARGLVDPVQTARVVDDVELAVHVLCKRRPG